MGKPVEVTRTEYSASALRGLAAGTADGAAVRRLLAIAMVLEGYSRTEAARLNGMDRQTLRDWVHRYNDEGIGGMHSRTSPGRPPALDETQMAALRTLVLEGPDPERNRVIRWRCADLRDEIAARWSVRLDERSVGRLLHRLEMTRLQPRPYHPKKDAVAQQAFKNVWPAPSASDFSDLIRAACVNVSGLWAEPWPRWRSARPGPHKLHGVERHFLKLHGASSAIFKPGFQIADRLSGHLAFTTSRHQRPSRALRRIRPISIKRKRCERVTLDQG